MSKELDVGSLPAIGCASGAGRRGFQRRRPKIIKTKNMLDPELKNYLSGINLHLTELKAKKTLVFVDLFLTACFRLWVM